MTPISFRHFPSSLTDSCRTSSINSHSLTHSLSHSFIHALTRSAQYRQPTSDRLGRNGSLSCGSSQDHVRASDHRSRDYTGQGTSTDSHCDEPSRQSTAGDRPPPPPLVVTDVTESTKACISPLVDTPSHL